jgi:hypothetical protein
MSLNSAFRLRQIGFVLHVYPPAGAGLGSFRTFRLFVGRASPPDSVRRRPRLGLFCAFTLGRPPRSVSSNPQSAIECPQLTNWLRFARFTRRRSHAPHDGCLCPHTPVPPSLASFRTNFSVRRLRRREIGFVLHDLPWDANRLPEIGFVLHIYPPAGPNWVRFAHLAFGTRPPQASFNPQSAIAGGSRPTNWLCLPVRKTAYNSHNPFTTNDFARIPSGANWLCSAFFLSRPPAEGPGLRVPPARMSLRGPTRSGATRRGRRSNLNGGSWGCALPTMADPSNMPFVACCLRFKARCSVVTAIQ